jgi:WD40 repeat protein
MNRCRSACVIAVLLAVCRGARGAEPAPDLTALAEHEWGVQVLTFSPDGKYLVSGCEQGVLRVTDVATGEALHELKAHPAKAQRGPLSREPPAGVLAVAIGTDGSTLYSGGGDRRLLGWDVKTGKARTLLEDLHVTGLALSPDGRTLAAIGYGGEMRLLDVAGKREPRKLGGGPPRATAALFSGDGKTLYTGGVTVNKLLPNCPIIESDRVRTWNVETGREGPNLKTKAHRLTATADGRTFVGCGAVMRLDRGPDCRGAIAFDDLGIGVESVTLVWGENTEKNSHRLMAHGLGAVPSPDGKLLLTAPGVEHYLEVGIEGGNSLGGITGAPEVYGWDPSNGQLLFRLPVRGVTALAFSPDGKRLAIGTHKGKVLLCDTSALKRGQLKPRTPDELWAALAAESWEESCRTLWTLEAGENRTVTYLAGKLFAPAGLDLRAIRRHIADFDADDFDKREAASAALEKIGPPAYRLAREALQKETKLEPARRLREFLQKYEPGEKPAPDLRRAVYALEVLEEIDTPEARELLRKAAAGKAMLPIDALAAEAVKRLDEAKKVRK